MAICVARAETLSPELVLVDPRLATRARAQLCKPADTLARLTPDRVSVTDDARAAALRRITQFSELDELPRRRRSYRVPKLTAAIATWVAALFIAVDAGLYDWSSWPL
jgi:hypothetical protein